MALETAGGRVGRTIYMDSDTWGLLAGMDVPRAARRGSDSAKLEALVLQHPVLVHQLEEARAEIARLRADLGRVEALGLQVEMAQSQVEAALTSVLSHLQPVQAMVWDSLRRSQ